MNIKNRITEQRTISTRELKPHPYNWRKHPAKQRKAFRAVLDEIGFAGVSLVYHSERHGGALTLIDGHMRIEEVGEFDIPCAITDLNDVEADKLLTLAAPIGDMAEADPAQLDALLRLVSIESDELEEMMQGVAQDLGCEYAVPAEIVQDEAPLPPDEAITKPGDIWILGDHRLMCGDSSKPEDLDRLLEGQLIHLVNSDPPYNVKVEPRSNNAIAAGLSSFAGPKHHQQLDVARDPSKAKPTQKKLRAKDRPLANDFVTDGEFDTLLTAWFGNMSRVLVPGGSFYIWGGYANLGNYPPVLKACGMYFSQGIVWDKLHPVLTRKDFMGCFELAFYGWKEGAAHQFHGPSNARDLWQVKKVNPQSMVHLTEKPVELAARAMQYSSKPRDNVLDLFGGSGSTLMGAEQTGRRAFLMELDVLYCDVIVQRWEKFTGRKAERITAAEVAA
ncbi:DNA modification methylase [Anatilimnocola sp. NA78]|uniref:DNA modification methylase n=1 Tax=Anatilimnocola sp. NA78 TaxID=3415683 RepID=UPI003CE47A8D